MSGAGVLYEGRLPGCCRDRRLGLPVPAAFSVTFALDTAEDDAWENGFDHWWLSLSATFTGFDEEDLDAIVGEHLGRPAGGFEASEVLAGHGVALEPLEDESWEAHRVGQSLLSVVRLHSDLGGALGRRVVRTGRDLWWACDDTSQDLLEVLGPLVDPGDRDRVWCDAVADAVPEVEACTSVIIIGSVVVAPPVRGVGAGAWTAAVGVAAVDDGRSLVLARPDPWDPPTTGQSPVDADAFATARARARLARYCRASLGLTPIGRSGVLGWNTMLANPALAATVAGHHR